MLFAQVSGSEEDMACISLAHSRRGSSHRTTHRAPLFPSAPVVAPMAPSPPGADDVSAPAMLQMFEATWRTMENRAPDIFQTGYGGLWTPPPGRADSGDQSVGYDVYDRFDLGSPGHPTLYGTQTGLKSAIDAIHKLGHTWTVDFVANHNGFSELGTQGFKDAGGYPGFLLPSGFDVDRDFHGHFE